jgi:hypothetical protein
MLLPNNVSAIYSINLTTGAATKVSDINIQATAMAVGLGFKSINVLNYLPTQYESAFFIFFRM